jgi:hypothetical protein
LGRVLVTNKEGDWGISNGKTMEKGRGEEGKEFGWLCQYYGLKKAQG